MNYSALLARRNRNRILTNLRNIHRAERILEGVATDAEKWALLLYAVDRNEMMGWLKLKDQEEIKCLLVKE